MKLIEDWLPEDECGVSEDGYDHEGYQSSSSNDWMGQVPFVGGNWDE